MGEPSNGRPNGKQQRVAIEQEKFLSRWSNKLESSTRSADISSFSSVPPPKEEHIPQNPASDQTSYTPMPDVGSSSAASHLAEHKVELHQGGPPSSSTQGGSTQEEQVKLQQYVRELEAKVSQLEGEKRDLVQRTADLERRNQELEQREVAHAVDSGGGHVPLVLERPAASLSGSGLPTGSGKGEAFDTWAYAAFAEGGGDGLDSRERAYFEQHRHTMEVALAEALREVSMHAISLLSPSQHPPLPRWLASRTRHGRPMRSDG